MRCGPFQHVHRGEDRGRGSRPGCRRKCARAGGGADFLRPAAAGQRAPGRWSSPAPPHAPRHAAWPCSIPPAQPASRRHLHKVVWQLRGLRGGQEGGHRLPAHALPRALVRVRHGAGLRAAGGKGHGRGAEGAGGVPEEAAQWDRGKSSCLSAVALLTNGTLKRLAPGEKGARNGQGLPMGLLLPRVL